MGGRVAAVFFDLDDTLLDGVTAMQGAWATVLPEAAEHLGCEPEQLREAIRREATAFWRDEGRAGHWRVRLDEAREIVIRAALAREGLDPAWAPRLSRRFAEEHRANLRPFEDAIPTLDLLRSRGLRLGLLTNGPAPLQRGKIERFGLERYFDVVVIEGEFGQGKPSAAVFAHALRAVEATPELAVMVGDNLFADIGGAKAVGLRAAWIHRHRLQFPERPPAVPDERLGHLLPDLPQLLDL